MQKCAPSRAEEGAHLAAQRGVDDHRVLRRAEHAGVECLAVDDVGDRLLEPRGALDDGGDVAGADAVRRLSRGIDGAHHVGAAGGEEHGDVAVPHERVGAVEGRERHGVDEPGGAPAPTAASSSDARGLDGAAHGARMRGHHDRVPRLDRDEGLVDRRRGGVGRGNDGARRLPSAPRVRGPCAGGPPGGSRPCASAGWTREGCPTRSGS